MTELNTRRRSTWTIRILITGFAMVMTGLVAPPATAKPSKALAAPDLGTNVTIFNPTMPVAEIQATLDATYAKQVDNEMGSDRYAFLFLPGSYGSTAAPLQVKVGYYTEIAGLGSSPTDVTIHGKVEVYNRCLGDGGTSNCIALNNFWRTLSNLTIDINGAGQDGCRSSANFWAVSQAVSMRRLNITGGGLSLMDYCTAGPQYASGGFIADSLLPAVTSGSQQQWLTRNSEVASWSNGVWNQVFSGTVGAPSEATFPDPPYTTLDQTPVSREKPFLFVDAAGRWAVRVPSAQQNSRGITWGSGLTPGRTVPLSDFFVAKPGDSPKTIKRQLDRGKHLLLTPGVYDIASSIKVKRANTVILGIGQATLTAARGAVPVKVSDVPGVVVAGLTVDAGPVNSPFLMQVGNPNHRGKVKGAATNPTTLSDVYFRVGGPHIGRAFVSLQVNSDHVLIDHTWVWRADHGIEGFTEGVNGDTDRWRTNLGRYGVIVNGDDVTATGLFVEHYQRHNVVWNGERGTTVFFQNELPYDPPTQADWDQGSEGTGWAAYKVADDVRRHQLYGGGSYVFNQNNPSIHTENGFEVPERAGVRLHHIMTVNLAAGTLDHVVNGVGAPADTTKTGTPVYLRDYPTG